MAPITKKDISDALLDFYGKLIEPEFNKIHTRLQDHDGKFTDLLHHFDQIYHRLERLETEYFTINSSLKRIEERLEGVDVKLDKEILLREELEREISDLKQRVTLLQRRIEEIETRFKTPAKQ